MRSFYGAQVQAADGLIFRVIFGHQRLLRQRIGAHGPRSDDLGRVHIAFHQYRRDSQHVGDIVEAVTGIVGGEIFFRAEIDGQQIANGVRIFAAVQAARRHVSRIGFHIAVGSVEFAFHVMDQRLHLRFGRTRNAFGRHLAGAQLVENGFPSIAVCGDRIWGQQQLHVQAAGCQLLVMAERARFGEHRLHGRIEVGRRGVGGAHSPGYCESDRDGPEMSAGHFGSEWLIVL